MMVAAAVGFAPANANVYYVLLAHAVAGRRVAAACGVKYLLALG